MRTFFRDNGLTIALAALFLVSILGMIWSGHSVHNKELAEQGSVGIGLLAYLASGDFLSALFENWESEFLQMAAYVMLTAILFQRGSAESRDPDDPDRQNDELPGTTRRRSRVLSWLYSHSLGIALALLFVVSFSLHWWESLIAANEEALRHGGAVQSLARLSVRRTAVVRVLSELAIGIPVDGRPGRAVDHSPPQGLAGIQTCWGCECRDRRLTSPGKVRSGLRFHPRENWKLITGLAILKHTFNLSDEVLCARWIENSYFQYLCGEEFFRHELPFDRSSMTRWRSRMGEERIMVLLQESLSIAVKTGAMKPQDTRRVIVDTTVQLKNVMFPTTPSSSIVPASGSSGWPGRPGSTASVLCKGRQAGADHASALRPRQTVQAS